MANIKIEERVERNFGVPFDQWVKERSEHSVHRLAGEADCNVVHLKNALKRHGFKVVTINRVVPEQQ